MGKKIFTSFENTEVFDKSKVIFVGNPIRRELLEIDEHRAREILDIVSGRPILLFWGGSLGAETINEFVLSILDRLLEKYEVIHVAGRNNYGSVKLEAKVLLNKDAQPYYHLYESLNELELASAFHLSHFIVSRAGSGSIFEIAAVGIPSILIPLPSAAGNHQSKNAYTYANTGAAIVFEQENLIPNFFLGRIDDLLSHPEMLEKMKQAALTFAKPNAAEEIANQILEFFKK